MLTATFSLFKGLSEEAEHRLWQQGIYSWNQFLSGEGRWFSPKKIIDVKKQITEAQVALEADLVDWFLNRLKGIFRTRVYPHYLGEIRYLDIETTGLSAEADITTIAVYDGIRLTAFIDGVNLREFPGVLKDARLLVTFNGTRFDLPILRRRFGIDLAMPHIDLLPIVKSIGYHGGLKACEKKMRIKRQVDAHMDGATAVHLWNRYRRYGDVEALRLLVGYNCQDVLSLDRILLNIYNRSMERYPLFKRLTPSASPNVWQPFIALFDN